MDHHRLSMRSVLVIALLAGPTTPVVLPWDEMWVKHAWNAVNAAEKESSYQAS